MTYAKTEYIYHYLTVIARNTAKSFSLQIIGKKRVFMGSIMQSTYLLEMICKVTKMNGKLR